MKKQNHSLSIFRAIEPKWATLSQACVLVMLLVAFQF